MTIAEIIYTLEQKLQILGSNVYSNLLPEEILLQFDNIVDRYIDACLSPKPEGSLLGISDTQLRVDNLRLLKNYSQLSSFTLIEDEWVAELPLLYRNLINDSVVLTICGQEKLVGCRLIGDEELRTNIENNPFLKARNWSPTSRVVGNYYHVKTESITTAPIRANLTYFRLPVRLYDEYVANQDDTFEFTDFPRNVQELFVDLLKNRLLETFESPRLPGSTQEVNNFGTLN